MKYVFYYETPVGKIGIAEENGAIVEISRNVGNTGLKETPLIKKAGIQLAEYFEGKRKSFDLPLNPSGTDFQKKVWRLLCKIPYGKTASYKETAAAAGNPNASRAVGGANNKNPIMIVIPCHRVIGSNGALTGYAGGLDMKQKLLDLEKNGLG
ncbi:MAG: methylated-DNA--[protein]-cysteine S-methyltransferase [Heliobacteriaceae bacterium]|jgi:methylated-DNA-[protein]-cysteine S-methyltransferase|nr:methylated-DNA--[protein]-cysteine S-methyltransferase [Heliobacteriaceae bacterium]